MNARILRGPLEHVTVIQDRRLLSCSATRYSLRMVENAGTAVSVRLLDKAAAEPTFRARLEEEPRR